MIGSRDAWSMVTMKVRNQQELPSWFDCEYLAKTQGPLYMVSTIDTGRLQCLSDNQSTNRDFYHRLLYAF